MDTKRDTSDSSGVEKQNQHSEKWSSVLIRNIQGSDSELTQAEDLKAEELNEAAQAMKENDLERAERSLKRAKIVDSLANRIRLQELQKTDNPQTSLPSDPAVDSTARIEEPQPDKQQTARPTAAEAKEGTRNVEGDLVERNPELPFQGSERKFFRR